MASDTAQPRGDDWRTRFPDARLYAGGEGEAVYMAEADGAFWVIRDSGTLLGMLSDDDRSGMEPVTVLRCESRAEAELEAFEASGRGNILEYFVEMFASALGRACEQNAQGAGLARINERDQLQPWSLPILGDMSTSHRWVKGRVPPPAFLPEKRSVELPEWPGVGQADLAVGFPTLGPPAFIELKAGSSGDALGACAWDVLKVALCLRKAACSRGYLLAAAPVSVWERSGSPKASRGARGGEFFAEEGYAWSALDLRERYRDWWWFWQEPPRPSPMPNRVPAEGVSQRAWVSPFTIGDEDWELRLASIRLTSDEWLDWERFSRPG